MVINKPKNGEICDDCGVELTSRVDDTEEKLRLRLDTFYTQTKPVIDYYRKQGVVRDEEISVSINRLAKEVAEDIVADIKK